MSSNALGTLLRIGVIFISLFLLWFIPTMGVYYLICFVSGMEFSLQGSFYLFSLVILFRAFYPKNVFKG